jgi:beta-lactamase class D
MFVSFRQLRQLAYPQSKASLRHLSADYRFRLHSQSVVRDIIQLESGDGKDSYGKTGWRFSSAPNLGW